MSVFLCVICIIWLAFIQQKLDKVSRNLDFLTKEIYKSQENEINPQKDDDTPPQSEVKTVEIKAESITSEPDINKNVDKKDDFNLQGAFLGNIFNKIGALAIIVAVIIFIKLVSPFIVITPLVKTILGCFAGVSS